MTRAKAQWHRDSPYGLFPRSLGDYRGTMSFAESYADRPSDCNSVAQALVGTNRMKPHRWLGGLAALGLVIAGVDAASVPAVALSTSRFPAPVDDWAYQLQGYGNDLSKIEASAFDLVVIDYSRFGDGPSEWSAAAIEALRNNGPCGRRTVLAYMSVGEAETYRYYWKDTWIDEDGALVPGEAPGWLGPFNRAYPDNYKVRYWHRSWQRIIFGVATGPGKSYLDRIIDQGFDGVYLDIIDAFEFWGPDEIDGNNERRQAPSDMVRLVRKLAKYARQTRGIENFLIVPQNGAGLIAPWAYPDAADPEREAARQRRRYFRGVDAIGAEDTFFFGNRNNNNRLDPQWETIALLDDFHAGNKPVLAIDYLTRAELIADFFGRAGGRGYIPYTSGRNLGSLPIATAFPPDCD